MSLPRLPFSIASGARNSTPYETFILSFPIFLFYFLNNDAHDIYDSQEQQGSYASQGLHKVITDQ